MLRPPCIFLGKCERAERKFIHFPPETWTASCSSCIRPWNFAHTYALLAVIIRGGIGTTTCVRSSGAVVLCEDETGRRHCALLTPYALLTPPLPRNTVDVLVLWLLAARPLLDSTSLRLVAVTGKQPHAVSPFVHGSKSHPRQFISPAVGRGIAPSGCGPSSHGATRTLHFAPKPQATIAQHIGPRQAFFDRHCLISPLLLRALPKFSTRWWFSPVPASESAPMNVHASPPYEFRTTL